MALHATGLAHEVRDETLPTTVFGDTWCHTTRKAVRTFLCALEVAPPRAAQDFL